MRTIEVVDHKGDLWKLIYTTPRRYLYKGHIYWKVWCPAPERPQALKNYHEIPLPIFTDWWPK